MNRICVRYWDTNANLQVYLAQMTTSVQSRAVRLEVNLLLVILAAYLLHLIHLGTAATWYSPFVRLLQGDVTIYLHMAAKFNLAFAPLWLETFVFLRQMYRGKFQNSGLLTLVREVLCEFDNSFFVRKWQRLGGAKAKVKTCEYVNRYVQVYFAGLQYFMVSLSKWTLFLTFSIRPRSLEPTHFDP